MEVAIIFLVGTQLGRMTSVGIAIPFLAPTVATETVKYLLLSLGKEMSLHHEGKWRNNIIDISSAIQIEFYILFSRLVTYNVLVIS